ncbi:MAG: phage major capsid protein [Azospirillum sp.]|nr:phage major capsid protein [Azospirillum sp.]
MPTLVSLKARKATVVQKMNALHQQIGARMPTLDQQATFDALRDEVRSLESQIQTAAVAETALVTSAHPIAGPAARTGTPRKGMTFAGVVRAFAAARGDVDRAIALASNHGLDYIAKGLTASDPTGGGLLVAPEVAEDFIDLLRPAEVVTPMVMDIRPLDAGAITIRRGTSDATASFKGEAKPAGVSQPGVGEVSLVARDLAAITPLSNNLLRFTAQNAGSTRADQFALNSLLRATALRKDLAFLRGDGASNTPRGLRSFAQEAGNLIAANATVNLTNIEADANKLLLALANANVLMIMPGWLMAPRTRIYLGSLRDGNGNRVYPEANEKAEDGRFHWRGYPILETTQMPINLGAGTNETEVGLVDFNEVVIGDVEGVTVEMSHEATYWDGTAWQSAFQNSETLIKVSMGVDINMKHVEGAAFLTGVKWF